MSPLVIGFVGVLLVPLFVATWRTSLLGLSCQGFLMAWIAYRLHPELASAGDWLTLVDLLLVRAVGAPLALDAVLRSSVAPARNDVIPPNLLSWTLALAIVLIGFDFAEALVPVDGEQRTIVAAATTALLLGFLVLATQAGTLSQMIGALRVENAIALFELSGHHDHEAVAVRAGQIVVVAVTLGLYPWYLRHLGAGAAGAPASAPDGSAEPPPL